MSSLRLTRLADIDFLEIWAHVAQASMPGAEKTIRRISSACEDLARFPRMGRLREELGPRRRSFAVGNYVIYYRQTEDGILVLRVLHGARDLGSISFPEE